MPTRRLTRSFALAIRSLLPRLTSLLVLVVLVVTGLGLQTSPAYAQPYSSYICESLRSGNWSDYNTWNNPPNYTNCYGQTPGININTIIRAGHTVTVDQFRATGSIYVEPGATLVLNADLRIDGQNSYYPGNWTTNYLYGNATGSGYLVPAPNSSGSIYIYAAGIGANAPNLYVYSGTPTPQIWGGFRNIYQEQGASVLAYSDVTLYSDWVVNSSSSLNMNNRTLNLRPDYQSTVYMRWDAYPSSMGTLDIGPGVTVYNSSGRGLPNALTYVPTITDNGTLYLDNRNNSFSVDNLNISGCGAFYANDKLTNINGTLNVDGGYFESGSSRNQPLTIGGNLNVNGGYCYSTYQNGRFSSSSNDSQPQTVVGSVNICSTCYLWDSNGTGNFNIGGYFTNNGNYQSSGRTVVFNGTGTQVINGTTQTIFYKVNVNKPSGELILGQDVQSYNDLTVSAGTLNLGGYRFYNTYASYALTVNGGTLKLGGSYFPNTGAYRYGALALNGGTVEFSGDSQSIPNSVTYQNLTLSGSGNATLAGNTVVNGALTLNSGTLSAGSRSITVGGNFTQGNGVFNPGVGDIIFNGSTTLAATTPITFNNLAINSGRALIAPGTPITLNIKGNWTNNGGTFTPGASTVAFVGNNQSISGANAFYNLSKTGASNAVLTFPAGQLQTVTGNLNLSGTSETARLALRSSAPGTQWQINPQGPRYTPYVDVRDSRNENALGIYCSTPSCFDGGNNYNWSFKPIAMTSVSVPPAGVYTSTSLLDFTVNWSNLVRVTGSPRLTLTVGADTRYATYQSSTGTAATTFRYTPTAGDTAPNGLVITGVDLNGGTLKDTLNSDVPLTLTNVASTALVRVDAVVPVVTSVAVPADATYGPGQSLDFIVNWNKPVNVTGLPRLTLTLASGTRYATYQSGSGSSALAFRYVVQSGDLDTDGLVVGGLGLNGGALRDAANNTALLALNTVGDTTAVRVNGVGPVVTSLTPPANATYTIGQPFTVTLHWDNPVLVTGTPILPLTVGATVVSATYQSGSGTQDLLFRYTVREGDLDSDGIATGSALILNNGTLLDALNNTASTALTVAGWANVKVDGVRPVITSVAGPNAGTYTLNDSLIFTTTFDSVVTVLGGTPRLAIQLGVNTRLADYVAAASTSTQLVFSYTVQADDSDTLDLLDNAIHLNGASLRDAAGNDAYLTLNNYADDGVLVDTTSPTVTSVAVPDAGFYRADQTLTFVVNWSEVVAVTNFPRLAFTLTSGQQYAVYESGSGTTALTFACTIQAGDTAASGITVDTLDLNTTGTLRDAANNATLALIAVGDTSNVQVDTTAPTVPTINRVNASPTNATSLAFAITFDEPVSGVAAGNFALARTGVTGGSMTSLVGSGAQYTATITGFSGSGTLGLNQIAAGSTVDRAGNGLSGTRTGQTYDLDVVSPEIASVSVPTPATYVGGEILSFTVNWSEAVVASNPNDLRLALTAGANTRYATYVSGNNTAGFVFTYTVALDDQARSGLTVALLDLNGSTLRDAASNDAVITLNSVGDTSHVNLQGTFGISLRLAGSGIGSVALDPNTSSYAPNTVVTLTETHGTTFLFGGWSGDVVTTTDTVAVTMNADKIITATFEMGGARYVDPSYDATTPGWGVTRFATIQAAINKASLGDAVYVAAAAYNESISLSTNITFIPADGVTISGDVTQSAGTLEAPAGTLTLGGNYTLGSPGVFNSNGGEVIFSKSSPVITGSITFAGLTMAGSGSLTATDMVTATGTLKLDAGTFNPVSGSQFGNITVASGATLALDPTDTLYISGDFTNNGTFSANGGAVILNGSSAQAIGGTHPTTFNTLLINNSGSTVTASSPITVTSALTVASGTFTPLGGSVFNTVRVEATGTFSLSAGQTIAVTNDVDNAGTFAPAGGTINVGGGFTNSGTFAPTGGLVDVTGVFTNSAAGTFNPSGGTLRLHAALDNAGAFSPAGGTVVFAGPGAQAIGGPAPVTFSNLINSNVAGLTTGQLFTVTQGFTVTSGVSYTPLDGTHLGSLTLDPGAALTVPAGGQLYLSGDFTNNGTLDANDGTVVFNGAGPQFIGGATLTQFDNLIASGGVVSATTAMTVTNVLTVTSGTFDPADGSLFNTVDIGLGGAFTLTAGETIAITGNLTNMGSFAPTEGTVNLGGDLDNSGTFVASGGTVNLSGNLTNTGTFAPTGGTVVFNGGSAQAITGPVSFANLVDNNVTGLTASNPLTVTQGLTLTSGVTFTPPSDSHLHDVSINSGGQLTAPAGGILYVGGAFTNNGTFDANNSTLVFNGAGPQTIGGTTPTTFSHLLMTSAYTLTASNPLTVTGGLTVTQGTLDLASSSDLNNVDIASGAALAVLGSGNLAIHGDVVNDGTFAPGNGTVTLNGPAPQSFGGTSPITFGNLVLENSVTFSNPLTVTQGVTLTTGFTFTPPNGSSFQDLTVDPSSTFRLAPGGNISVGGSLTNNGMFDTNGGTVTFDGIGAQSIGGSQPVIFDNLVMTGSGTLSSSSPITVTNSFTVTSGTVTPADGSQFTNVVIGVLGTLAPAAGAHLTVSGDWTNDGTFTANGSTVTFDGTSGPQTIGGAAPTTFNALFINNAAGVSATSPIAVTDGVTVTNGTFDPAGESTFSSLNIESGGTFNLTSGETITVTHDLTNAGHFTPTGGTLNLGGDLTNAGTFAPSGGTVVFDGTSGSQTITGDVTFASLVMTGSGTLATSNPITVTNELSVTTGLFMATTGSVFHDVAIGSSGALTLPSDGSITVSGDWTNDGTFTANGSTVIFDGTSGPQTIGGAAPTTFNALFINNAAGVSAASPIAVTDGVTITNGAFDPADGSTFSSLDIESGGTFNLTSGETITVTHDLTNAGHFTPSGGTLNLGGDLTNTGTFAPSGGTVVFDGTSGPQTITGDVTFASLVTSNTAGLNANNPLTVTQELTITSGVNFIPPSGSDFHSVTIGTGGTLTLPPGGNVTVSGDFTNDGTFTPNGGTVIFDGGPSAQTIDGSHPVIFDNLVLNGTGTLSSANPITVTQGLTVTQGTFAPANDSSFDNITIGTSGTLAPLPGANISVSGDFINDGAFTPNNGIVTFNGAGTQIISGTAPSTFFSLIVDGSSTILAPSNPITVTDYVTLTLGTFIPANGSAFNNLSVGPGSTLSIPLGSGITIDGTYTNTGGTSNASQLTVYLAGDGSGAVNSDPEGMLFATGTVITVTANPVPGSRFFRWAGDLLGSTNPTTLTLSVDRIITATFVPIARVWPVNSSPVVLQQTTDFTTTLSGDGALSCTWDFGDGTAPSAGLTASHAYTQVGTYLATVTGTSFTNTVTATTTVVVGDLMFPVVPGLDNTLVYTTTQGGLPITATLEVPAGAAAGAETLVLTGIQTSTHSLSNTLKFAGLNFSLNAYITQTRQAGFHFQVPVTLTLAYDATDVRPDDEPSFNLLYWNGTFWATDGITLIQRDTVNHQLVYTLDHLSDLSLTQRGIRIVYLPFVINKPSVLAPDLIVQRLIVSPNNIQVVIKNQGYAAVTNEFWVEVYVAPTTPPTAVNQSWPMLGKQGLTWGATTAALPQLQPGGVLTLTVNGSYYVPAYSKISWPLAEGLSVYAQVDSVNHATNYGAVRENHEITGGTYNNIAGPAWVAAANQMAPLTAQPITHLPGDGDRLPLR
jgi:hypothetical protein